MISSQLALKQLEAFVSVVDTGSFRRAATALNTTQPNVSNRISTLDCDRLPSLLDFFARYDVAKALNYGYEVE